MSRQKPSKKARAGNWTPRNLSAEDSRPKGRADLCDIAAHMLDPDGHLCPQTFDELKESIYLAACGYCVSDAMRVDAPNRQELAAKFDRLMRACAGLRAALNSLDDASLSWLFATGSDRMGDVSWRMPDLPPPDAKRRSAVDCLLRASLYEPGKIPVSAPVEAIIAGLQEKVVAPLASLAEAAVADLEASKRREHEGNEANAAAKKRKTGSIADLTQDTPKRLMVEGCLHMYAHYFPGQPITGTWSSPPARLVRAVYEVATGKNPDDDLGAGLETIFQHMLPIFRASPNAYPELLRWRRCERALREFYAAIASEQKSRIDATRAAVREMLKSGAMTAMEVEDWTKRHAPPSFSTSLLNLTS